MTRFFRGIPAGRIALLGLFDVNHDVVSSPGYEELKEEQRKSTGIDGVRRVFSSDKYGRLSPEFITFVHMSSCSILAGGLLGGFLYGKQCSLQFMENNQATQFANHFEAQRELQQRTMMAIGKGGLKWGFKIGAFSTIFLLSNMAISAYNGKAAVIGYASAGAITGGLFKWNLGIKGIITGTVVGTVLGAIAGVLSLLFLYCTGFSMEDIQQSQYELRKLRNEQMSQAGSKNDTEEALNVLTDTFSHAN